MMARSIIQAQAASPTFTHVYAALVAIVNTKVSADRGLIDPLPHRLVLKSTSLFKYTEKEF